MIPGSLQLALLFSIFLLQFAAKRLPDRIMKASRRIARLTQASRAR